MKPFFKVMTIDDYHHNVVKKDLSGPSVSPVAKPGGASPTRRRAPKPTVKMAPISNTEAATNLRAGKFYEKSVFELMDFLKAMEAMPKPSGAKPPGYLPGVSSPASPMRKPMGLKKKPDMAKGEGSHGGHIIGHTKSGKPVYGTKLLAVTSRGHVNEKKTLKNAHAHAKKYTDFTAQDHRDAQELHSKESSSANPNATGGTLSHAVISHAHRDAANSMDADAIVRDHRKSLNTENTMSTSKYEDLFKSELGIDGDKALIDCPHCEVPITKSEIIAKAKKIPKEASVAGDNKDGKNHRGPDGGHNSATPVRSASGVPKHGHGMPGAHDAQKSEKCDDDSSSDAMSKSAASANAGPQVRGSAFVQYVNSGADEALAKAIQEGTLGQGAILSQPIDKNNSRTRQ